MSTDREKAAEIHKYLHGQKNSIQIKKVVELITMTRAKCLEGLEKRNDEGVRGKSQFCKELIKILSE